eukprot:Platyproteum_vivax@DN253_c0_g1_i1.p1
MRLLRSQHHLFKSSFPLRQNATSLTAASQNHPPSVSTSALLNRETLSEKAYRWIDVGGFFTRWNNRKEWILNMPSHDRPYSLMMTEFDRKARIFCEINGLMGFMFTLWALKQMLNHVLESHAPLPENPLWEGVRRSEHEIMTSFYPNRPWARCKHCRQFDGVCKKECFDQLRIEGYSFPTNPYSRPRVKLEPSHFVGDHHHH